MTRAISSAGGTVSTTVRVPGSKSMTHRALVCAALAEGTSTIRNASECDDSAMTVNGLNQLGVLVRRSDSGLIVEGKGGRIFAPKFPIPVGNSGTTLRFLVGVAALADGIVSFHGTGRMAERPMGALLDALRHLGVETEALDFAGTWAVRGGSLRGGDVTIRSDVSSQFVSSLMMVAPYAQHDVALLLEGDPVSTPYIGMTEQIMKMFGVVPEWKGRDTIHVRSGRKYSGVSVTVEPDISLASVFFAAAAVTGGEVRVAGLRPGMIQGDNRILDYLGDLGCTLTTIPGDAETESFIGVRAGRAIPGRNFDLRSTPDLVPVLVVIALFAGGPGSITNVPHLRFKESDRLSVLSDELKKTGAKISLREDGLVIEPTPLHGAELDPHGDHRLAMCFALVGLKVPGVTIKDPGCVSKSFPGFWEAFAQLEGGGSRDPEIAHGRVSL